MGTNQEKDFERRALEDTTITNNKDVVWWKDSGLLKLNSMLFFLMFSEFTQGYDASLINNVQQLDVWQDDLNHPRGSLLGAMSAMYWIGNIAGVIFISSISDHLGRRWCLMVGALLCLLGTGLATGSYNAGMFIAARLILGLGGVIVAAIGPMWVGELAHPAQRATATAMSNTTYSAGAILSAWVTFGSFRINSSWAWRIPTILQAFPSVLQVIGAIVLPDVGREQDALEILAKYHGNGDLSDPLVMTEFEEMQQTIEMEIAAKKTAWVELCPGVCKQWSGNGLVSYYLGSMLKSAGITKTLDTTLITATSNMFSFAASIAFAFLPGRRPLLLWSLALMWVIFAVITACSGVFAETGNLHAGYVTVAMIYLYNAAHNLGWTGAMMLYGAFNTYVNPIGLDAIDWKYYFVYVAWIIVEFVVVYFLFIETKGPSLEQIAVLFDGKDATVGGRNVASRKILDEDVKDKEVEVSQVEHTAHYRGGSV
ncbi:hypothetical protein KEM56_001444 [Ascosphaera pollenicola]|nr:hypothetical protein KEM56_001444 [Ascosphaera pollenicola]